MNTVPRPRVAVDIIIQINGFPDRIVLIKRKNPPFGWAIPGGFVDYGETVDEAAKREALEETSLGVNLIRQFHVYSDPQRDSRGHTISVVFIGSAHGTPIGADDAVEARVFEKNALPAALAFDHREILSDYFNQRY
ncbi:MAG: NUDIX hydrolase [Acidobacteria bacterium]|nr:MAG: NUDIX hydrolase [Acidobacteriota bacterium]